MLRPCDGDGDRFESARHDAFYCLYGVRISTTMAAPQHDVQAHVAVDTHDAVHALYAYIRPYLLRKRPPKNCKDVLR